jgi:hypothetical protein
VQRWIEADHARTHAVVLTRDRHESGVIPSSLERRRIALEPGQTRLQRASAIAAIAHDFDVVVTHANPDDPIPALTLPSTNRPSIMVNHADHVCWLDPGATTIAHIRQSGQKLAAERRGLPGGEILPIPLDPPPRLPTQSAARAQLGLPHDAVMVLTVASNYKFQGGVKLLGLIGPVMDLNQHLFLVAIGPGPGIAWEAAAARTGGRVIALDPLPDTRMYLAAADIYLDSWPTPSITSLLEAALCGVPTISRVEVTLAGTVLATDSPGLGPDHIVATNDDDWRRHVTRLGCNQSERRARGEGLASSVARAHVSGWPERLDSLYLQASTSPQVRCPPPAPSSSALDRELVRMHRSDATNFPGPMAIIEEARDAAPPSEARTRLDRLLLLGRTTDWRRLTRTLRPSRG